MDDSDDPREECGIIGIHDASRQVPLAHYLVLGMLALQHRGQESAGIATWSPDRGMSILTGMGKVREVFGDGCNLGGQVFVEGYDQETS